MRDSHRPIKKNQLNQIRDSQFMRKFIVNVWTILIILVLLTVISYSIYVQFAHHVLN